MSLLDVVGDSELQQMEMERMRSLLVMLGEFLDDEMPREDDPNRAWKLENFCRRQDLLESLVNSIVCKLDTIIKSNEGITQTLDFKTKIERTSLI